MQEIVHLFVILSYLPHCTMLCPVGVVFLHTPQSLSSTCHSPPVPATAI